MAVIQFDNIRDAYDASQIDLDRGAILVIESQEVVGLSWTWPIAVTKQSGIGGNSLHSIEPGYEDSILSEAGFGHYDIVDAVKEAKKRGVWCFVMIGQGTAISLLPHKAVSSSCGCDIMAQSKPTGKTT